MSDAINALEALRDAAFDPWACDWIKRAIAKLRAEQPAPAKACAGYELDRDGISNVCRCGQPYSAHQPSEQPLNKPTGFINSEQPSPKVEVPPMPNRWAVTDRGSMAIFKNGEWCDATEVRALYAAAVALAERCERVEREREAEKARFATIFEFELPKAERERDEARAQLAAEKERAERAENERDIARSQCTEARACESPQVGEPRIPCSEAGRGAVLGQWIDYARALAAELRTAQEQRDHWRRECTDIQDGPLREAREELEAVNAEFATYRETASETETAMMTASGKLVEAQLELAALRRALVAHDRDTQDALRERGRQERERCAKVADEWQRNNGECPETAAYVADAIRALPEEVEK